MIKVVLVLLHGYREWTETLGADREWLIQARQAELHMLASVEASRLGGMTVPFRHDMILVLASGINATLVKTRLEASLSDRAPVPVEARVGCGSAPAEALDNAFYGRDGCTGGLEATLLAHIDINHITSIARERGVYAAWDEVVSMLSAVHGRLRDYGVIATYLGGDNVLTVLPLNDGDALTLLEDIVEEFNAKAGVGLGVKPRRAMMLATRCLDRVRAERGSQRIRFCSEPGLASKIGLDEFEWESGGQL